MNRRTIKHKVNMTAAEKAKELFYKFYITLFDSDSDKGQEILVSILAKKCAEIAVEEMLIAVRHDTYDKALWEEIKNEIQKL